VAHCPAARARVFPRQTLPWSCWAARLKLNAADIYNLVFYGLVAGLIGARLAHAAHYLGAYLASPLSLFALTPATVDINAGLVTGVAVAALFGWQRRLPLRPTLDALAPGLAAFMVALGLAHLFSGDAFGAPIKLPWSVYLWNAYRHPSQIFETLAALVIFAIVWVHRVQSAGDGLNFLFGVAFSAAARVFLEAFRGDSLLWPGGFRAAQVIGLLILAMSFWRMHRWARSSPTPPEAVS
jgi:phosphatidylglycerol:prolipoprotein diacylglycerol transferase